MAQRSLDAQTEHHDVDWELGFPHPGLMRVMNVGSTEARQVRIRAVVEGEEREIRAERLQAGATLGLDFRRLSARLAAERRAAEREVTSGTFYSAVPPDVGTASGYVRIFWRTPMGASRDHEIKLIFDDLT